MNVVQKICDALQRFISNVAACWACDTTAHSELSNWELRNKLRTAELSQEEDAIAQSVTVPPEIVMPAKGTRGHLLYIYEANIYVFRTYTADGGFKDYDIRHTDLHVVVNDDDAYFYDGPNRRSLDHSPETLGRSS